MSDSDLMKKLDIAMSRIAQLEADTSRRNKEQQAPQFNQADYDARINQALISDPVGFFKQRGVPVDHVGRVVVAHHLGKDAPLELQAAVAMGPQINATQALQTQLEDLRRQLSDMTGAQSKKSKRESFRALAADKTKHPGLAKALEKNAALYDEDVESFGGSAEDFAAREEKRLLAMGYYAPQPASEEDAETTSEQGQSTQTQPAVAALLNGEMPLRPKQKVGVFTADDHDKLKEEVLRKVSPA